MKAKQVLEKLTPGALRKKQPETMKWLLWGSGALVVTGLVLLGGGWVRKPGSGKEGGDRPPGPAPHR